MMFNVWEALKFSESREFSKIRPESLEILWTKKNGLMERSEITC